jgi:hypothetical protein
MVSPPGLILGELVRPCFSGSLESNKLNVVTFDGRGCFADSADRIGG